MENASIPFLKFFASNGKICMESPDPAGDLLAFGGQNGYNNRKSERGGEHGAEVYPKHDPKRVYRDARRTAV